MSSVLATVIMVCTYVQAAVGAACNPASGACPSSGGQNMTTGLSILQMRTAASSTTVAAGQAVPDVSVQGFGAHIEGASVDAHGNVYATHFRNNNDESFDGNNVGRNVVGKVDVSTGQTSVFFEGEAAAVFNGMRWHPETNSVFLADVGQSKVVRVDLEARTSRSYCGGADSVLGGTGAPNDLALSKSGLLFLSGQNWGSSTGGLWLCNENIVLTLESGMGRTNGIALSPDDRTLYLTEAIGSPVASASEATGQRIWRYDVAEDGSISGKEEFFNFATDTTDPEADVDSDGMRADMDGNLYVTRNGKGKVSVISPAGKLVSELSLNTIKYATNLAFGGTDGKMLYVVGRCGSSGWGTGSGCIEAVMSGAESSGREWALMHSSAAPEPEPEPELEAESEEESDAEAEAEAESEAESEPETVPELEPESQPAPEPITIVEPKAEPEPVAPEPQSEEEPSTPSEALPESDPEGDSPDVTAPEPEPESEPETDQTQDCVSVHGKCGGQSFTGSTCCKIGLECIKQNDWYSQCLPIPDDESEAQPKPVAPEPQPEEPSPALEPLPESEPEVDSPDVTAPEPEPEFEPETDQTQDCVSIHEKCGGQSFTGSTCCKIGLECVKQSDWYSQCLPIPDDECAMDHEQCGGTYWTGKSCCAAGLTCQEVNAYHHKCVRE